MTLMPVRPSWPATYSTDGVPGALASALVGYSGTTMGDTGDTVTVGGYTFTCVAGPCSVSVSDDEERVTVRGTINVAVAMTMPPPEPEPTAYEKALMAIAAADTAAAAQAAYDAVKDDVSAAEGDLLQAAVNARIAALETMAREAAQKMALMDAAGRYRHVRPVDCGSHRGREHRHRCASRRRWTRRTT